MIRWNLKHIVIQVGRHEFNIEKICVALLEIYILQYSRLSTFIYR